MYYNDVGENKHCYLSKWTNSMEIISLELTKYYQNASFMVIIITFIIIYYDEEDY